MAAPARQHEAAGLRPAREQGSEVAGGSQAGLGVDAEPAALVRGLVSVRSESMHHDRGKRHREQNDQDDGQPVGDGPGKVRARGLLPREAWVAGVTRKACQGGQSITEPGTQQSSASDDGGEVADEPVSSGRRCRDADGEHEHGVVAAFPSRCDLRPGHRVTGSR